MHFGQLAQGIELEIYDFSSLEGDGQLPGIAGGRDYATMSLPDVDALLLFDVPDASRVDLDYAVVLHEADVDSLYGVVETTVTDLGDLFAYA